MKRLDFTRGAALRTVFIDGRKISFLTAELNNVPLVIDLDKLDEEKKKMKKLKMDKKTLEVLASLKTEEEIILDVVTDFEKSGWRLVE